MKLNKYIVFNESTKDFIAGVKYRIKTETKDYYIVKLQKIKKSDEHIKYRTGEIISN